MKTCKNCNETKSLTDYYDGKQRGKSGKFGHTKTLSANFAE